MIPQRVGSKITQVIPIDVKETRCLGILSAKCPVIIGPLRTDYAKLFLYDPKVDWIIGFLKLKNKFEKRCEYRSNQEVVLIYCYRTDV